MLGALLDLLWIFLIVALSVSWAGGASNGGFSNRNRLPDIQVRRPALLALGIALVPVIFVFATQSVVTVPPGHVAAVYDPLRGGIQAGVLPEGLHFVMPYWRTKVFSQQTQSYTMSGTSQGASEESGQSDDAIRCQTNEGMNVAIDCTVLFHVDPAMANRVWDRLGENIVGLIVRPYTQNVLRMVAARYSVVDVYTTKRKVIESEVTEAMKPLFSEKGVVLEQLLIRNVSYGNPAFADAINAKQVAQQQVQTEEQKLEKARIEKQTVIAEARGEASAIEQRGATLRENPEVVQYEFIQKVAPRLNTLYLPAGLLPVLKGGH